MELVLRWVVGMPKPPPPPTSFLFLGVKETMTAPATTSSQIKNMLVRLRKKYSCCTLQHARDNFCQVRTWCFQIYALTAK